MQHKPRLTPFGRLLVVQRVTELGWPPATAAEAVGVVLLLRAIIRVPSTLSAQAKALEDIRRTLADLKQVAERLERKVEDSTEPTRSSEGH